MLELNALNGLNVLVVDDDNDFRAILCRCLKSFLKDVSLTELTGIGELRKRLIDHEGKVADLIVLDQNLADGQGISFLKEGLHKDSTILLVSSDIEPSIPGDAIQAGAAYFLYKRYVTQPLFEPLVKGILERGILQRELVAAKLSLGKMDAVKTLIATLRHEINNPLGAVLGAAYLLSSDKSASPEQQQAAALVEKSGQRIKHVLEELCKAVELEAVRKSNHLVFHVPGDESWDGKKD